MRNESLPSAAWEIWTPERASSVLEAQKKFGPMANRSFKPQVAKRYAADMASGRWRTNGETLVFNGERCLDGQHRLHAIADSGVTLKLLTVRNVPVESMPTIDVGLVRTPGDVFRSVRSEVVGGYYNACAAAARIVYAYLTYRDIALSPERMPTRATLVETLDSNPNIVESVKWFYHAENRKSAIFRSKLLAAWHYLCGRKFPAERDVFFTELMRGVNLGAERPVRILRERLLMERGQQRQLPSVVISAFVVKAWNAEMTGRGMKILRHRNDEPFPVLYGDEDMLEVRE